jgi:hypothetical protein
MEEARDAVESVFTDIQRAPLIRATKMNVAASRVFVDFLFVDNGVRLDSIVRRGEIS